jgi:hypothetical protein
MRAVWLLLLGSALAAVTAAPAAAQTRDGLFFGAGLGYGWARVEADEFGRSDREGSWTLNLRVGTTFSERLLGGVEMNGWFDSEGGDSISLFDTTIAAYYYPTNRPVFVKGGVGLSRADFETGGVKAHGIGAGLMLGAGYDVEIGHRTAVTPHATLWLGKPGDLNVDDVDVLHGFKHNVLEVGVAVSFY